MEGRKVAIESPDQYEAAIEHLLQMLFLATERPGLLMTTDLREHLALAAQKRDRHGDFGAARLLIEWADRIDAAAERTDPAPE
ncbi:MULTISPECIES: hypothetical protein [Paracoccus]|jgi:hypothetical protein|uniref:Uncharacterized protein n=2 Tax=Paracoccus TaxID=265 RepID=A0A369TXV0_PARVE|nr:MULTISPECIES: hypothetical protein [Paracoccus]RQP05467.1 MAG: hypothetical protein D1H97_12660 [Paracoccus sp. BP8]WGR60620.1 hypothetical protein E3U26_07865 [Paracoccus ferrooxidans]MBB4630197.1 hypothetical protein [Paracoccus denitrificans]MBT0779375.1 hypothetical protein [Paracoccus sp. pheM1]MCU7431579.1 hypothetical protein [Paracoccus denitrificans]